MFKRLFGKWEIVGGATIKNETTEGWVYVERHSKTKKERAFVISSCARTESDLDLSTKYCKEHGFYADKIFYEVKK